ncbi:YfhO family protein [Nitrospinaceae bacterium]|nr:YfhO family protein [Nitrospinaceae bacterium]
MHSLLSIKQMSWKKDVASIIIASVASYFTMAMIYPDLLIHHNIYFMHQHDTEVPFLSVFTLISNYYNGGIQLWNPYDQMTYFFYHLSTGLYTIANITTAAIYILLAPFIEYPGEAFQSIYAVGFHGTTILIRTIGGYLLLRRLKISPVFIFVSLIYLNTLLSSLNYLGLLTNNLYSFFPLLAYFMLRFFEGCRLNDFLASLVVMTLAVANSPLLALGYFYQAVHFYILVGLTGIWFLANKPSIKSIYIYIKIGITLKNIVKTIVVGGLCLAIMLPYLQMERTLQTDFYIPQAFSEESGGRMTNKHGIKNYFSKPTAPTHSPKQFLLNSMDFNTNRWWFDWGYLGFSTFFFAGMGFFFSKDKRKHFFFWPIIFIIFLQFPRDSSSLFSIAHWINILTNPFQYLCRAFSMTTYLIPYFLLPLIALGMQSSKELIYYNKSNSIHFDRVSLGLLLFVISLAYFSFCLPEEGGFLSIAVKFCLYILALLLIFMWASWENRKTRFLSWLARNRSSVLGVGLSLVLLLDLTLFSIYINKDQWSNVRIFAGHSNHMADKDLINLTYQNPQTIPFREFYSTVDREMIIHHPEVRIKNQIKNSEAIAEGVSQYPDSVSWYRLGSRLNAYGHFYKFTHLGRYFFRPTIYHPRHMTYKDLYTDIEGQNYLKNDQRIMFQANYAVDSELMNPSQGYKEKVSSQFLSTSLSDLIYNRSVVSINGMGEKFPNDLSKSFAGLEGKVGSNKRSEHSFIFSLRLENGQATTSKGLMQYSLNVPKGFPSYTSTSILTKDQFNMAVSIGSQKLKPAQGKLVRPFTYDLQNINAGKLTILLPEEYNIKNQPAVLELKQNSAIRDIWKNENDNLGIIYSADRDGWLVLHFPYDERWKVTINEKPVKVYKANKYFIGFPVQKGEHKILIQYWPGTSLRTMIAVSIFLVIITFLGLIVAGIRKENSGAEPHHLFS